jgi:RNA polymerase sigma-70 factor (ECF subfamily)
MPGLVGQCRAVAEAPSDAALVTAARGGDRVAYGELYARYGRMVHGILLARTPRREVADLVQDVFLAAWRRLEALREPQAFGAWVAMIARRRAADYHRHQPPAADPLDREPTGPAGAEEASAVLSALRALPEAYRETLVLRLVEGLSGPEIAQQTGLTHGSVRVNLHRGLKLLRERLGERR